MMTSSAADAKRAFQPGDHLVCDGQHAICIDNSSVVNFKANSAAIEQTLVSFSSEASMRRVDYGKHELSRFVDKQAQNVVQRARQLCTAIAAGADTADAADEKTSESLFASGSASWRLVQTAGCAHISRCGELAAVWCKTRVFDGSVFPPRSDARSRVVRLDNHDSFRNDAAGALERLCSLAHDAERYEDMFGFVQQLVELRRAANENVSHQHGSALLMLESQLTEKERGLLSDASRNIVGSLRASWRTLSSKSTSELELFTC